MQPEQEKHSFADYRVRARQRGREVMQAVAEEFPEITLMTYRLFCDLLPVLDSGAPDDALEPSGYGLQPAFVDGWCDVMPPTVQIVEGDEDGYRFNSEADFNRAYTRLRTRLPLFVSPENRDKFRNQLRIGHGIYLDAHTNPPTSPWYIDRLGGTSAQRLTANVASALAAADGFVWIYGEQGRWWPGGDARAPFWPEKLAGADRALLRAKDPLAYARAALTNAQPDANRLTNPAFTEATAEGLPKNWWTWQEEGSKGRFSRDAEAACLTAMANGVFGQNVPVNPGETYAVRVRVRTAGKSFAALSIGWKTAEERWSWAAHRTLAATGAADADGWREVVGLVTVPAEARYLVFMLATRGQTRDTDRGWFDDAQLIEIED